mgnify:FL=1
MEFKSKTLPQKSLLTNCISIEPKQGTHIGLVMAEDNGQENILKSVIYLSCIFT